MFLVGIVDAVLHREIQPAHDADALGGGAMHARDFRVAGGCHQVDMEAFVQVGQPFAIVGAFAWADQPRVRQRLQRA
ncbi:hypothetical protein D3C77_712030 [compost metagenome]